MEIDLTSNLNTNFELYYRRASGRLCLLSKLRCFLDSQTACEIYRSMIVPFVIYCGILNLKLTTRQSGKLAALRERAMHIIGRNSKECNVVSPERVNVKRACVLVHTIINYDIYVALQGHFRKDAHSKTTGNNNFSISLPKIITEYARQIFFTWGLSYIAICRQESELPKIERTLWKN